MAHVRATAAPLEMPAWKSVASVSAAVILAILFVVAGTWKITDPYDAATRMIQAKIPGSLALPTAIGFGIAETFAAVLLFVPRFRRWGALLTGAMLIAFMIYIGINYQTLRGAECSCFPWLKRAIGPGFFVADGLMLALAAVAAVWSRPSESKRSAFIILGAVSVFALASLGVAYTRQSGVQAPETITVNGQPYSLRSGRHFIYFFDPECSHCYQAAKAMATYSWKDAKIVGVPTSQPRFAPQFLIDTGLKAELTSDLELLKKTFPFGDAPFAVAIEDGRQKESFIQFEGDEPKKSLQRLGWVE